MRRGLLDLVGSFNTKTIIGLDKLASVHIRVKLM
jgi:hypothetical protein